MSEAKHSCGLDIATPCAACKQKATPPVGEQHGTTPDLGAFVDWAYALMATRDHLRAFASELVTASYEGGSFDGCDIQDIAVRHGLLRIERRDKECGEACACREYGFPVDCYRKTALLDQRDSQNLTHQAE